VPGGEDSDGGPAERAHADGVDLETDIDRDFFMTAEEAKAYGIIDDIIVPARGLFGPGGTYSTPVEEPAIDRASR